MTTDTSPAPATFERTRAFAPTLLLGVAAFTIAMAGARSVGDIIGPVFLALVLTVTLHPIRLWLERTRLPEWGASILMLLAAYLVVFLLTLALIVSVARLADLLPQYADQMHEAVVSAGNTLRDLGVKQSQIDAVLDAIDPGQARRLRDLAALQHAWHSHRPLLPSHRPALHDLRHRLHPPQPGLAGQTLPRSRGRTGQLCPGHPRLHGRLGRIRTHRRSPRRSRPADHGRPGRVRVGRARLRHQLHPQHRLRHRGDPARTHRPAGQRSRA